MNLLLLAQAATAAASDLVFAEPASIGQQLLTSFLSPAGLAAGLGVVGSILGLIVGNSEVRRRRVALATNAAFHIVEDIAAEDTSDNALDKVALGLKALNEYMLAHGWRPAKPGEQEVAKLNFKVLNGQAEAATSVAANAIAAAATP